MELAFGSKARRAYQNKAYASRLWRRLRARQLAKQPLCVACESEGRVTAASHVDHIRGWESVAEFRDTSNLQSLCPDCHRLKSAFYDIPAKARAERTKLKVTDA